MVARGRKTNNKPSEFAKQLVYAGLAGIGASLVSYPIKLNTGTINFKPTPQQIRIEVNLDDEES